MTLIDKARDGKLTDDIRKVAKKEGLDPEFVRDNVAAGRLAIPRNIKRKKLDVEGVGTGLRTKVNANIGTSKDKCSIDVELKKLAAALDAGADAVMDLSTGGNLTEIRRAILDACPKPLGTVPLYETLVRSTAKYGKGITLDAEELFDIITQQAEEGVDFMTLHAGLTLKALELLRKQPRVTGIVSRGGAYVAAWMSHTGNENPLYEQFDRLLKICRKYEITLSLGDGLRPGSLADAHDRAMIQELTTLGELARRCRESGVQAMIEGPGHMPLNTIVSNIQLQKSLCDGAPYYVLGPLVTDIAPGYDHITSAIGGTIAAAAGADFLCYVTPSEHLGLPEIEDVRQGVIAARIAAHSGDIVKYPRTAEIDRRMSFARKALDWDTQESLAIDPSKFAIVKSENKTKLKRGERTCTMCGEFCAYEVSDRIGVCSLNE